jgi:polyhydroxybutyrate depolymerase
MRRLVSLAPRAALVAALASMAWLTACSGADTEPTGGGGHGAGRPADAVVTEDLQGRAYELHAPSTIPDHPAPLLVMLHGFSPSKTPEDDMEKEMHVLPEADARGIFVAQPLGSWDPVFGRYVWNATDSCCGWNVPDANDIGFIHAMITEIEGKYSIDPKRIFVFGHSNGGFMAHRLACDTAGRFAGIVSLAGAPWKNPDKCRASAPIAMLQVHGDADTTVPYDGGPPYGIAGLAPAPSALDLTAMWAAKNRCDADADTSAAPVDVVADLSGAETHKRVYAGCEANGATELWTLEGGVHSPDFSSAWAKALFDFLMAHPKP